ncbi:FH14, partial [Symbiodinium pilosum]
MAKNRAAPSVLLSAAAASVACWLLLVTVGDAFVSPAPTNVRATASWQGMQPAATTAGPNTFASPPDQKLSLFKTAASAALLCLAASRLIKGRSQKSPVVRRAVITLNAGTATSPEKPMVNLPQFDEPAATVDTLVDAIVDTQVDQRITNMPELFSLDPELPSLTVIPDTQTSATWATADTATTTSVTVSCLCG